jgi:hypothetical protein
MELTSAIPMEFEGFGLLLKSGKIIKFTRMERDWHGPPFQTGSTKPGRFRRPAAPGEPASGGRAAKAFKRETMGVTIKSITT